MYYILNERFALRGYEKLPYALLDTQSLQLFTLDEESFVALSLCNGQVEIDSLLVPTRYRKRIETAERQQVVSRCEYGKALTKEQKYLRYPCRYMKSAHWSVTGRCNYRCRHCFLSAPDAKLGELSHETCMDIVEQLAECGITSINLTGGEPLVREDFMELVDALLLKGIRIRQIYTNGALVNESLLQQLLERGVRCEFNLSFDGVGWHDWMRGINGAETAAVRAFDLLRAHNFSVGCEMCIHKKNVHTLMDTVRFLSGKGVRGVKIIPAALSGAWIENGAADTLSNEELFEAYLEFITAYFAGGAPMSVMLGGFFACRKGSEKYELPCMRFSGGEKACDAALCGSARTLMYIGADGRVLPCMPLSGTEYQEEFPLLTEMRLQDILTSSDYMKHVDTRLHTLLARNDKCRECEYKYLCGGGCRANALMETGDYYGIDSSICEIFRKGYIAKIHDAGQRGIELRRHYGTEAI